MDLAQLAIEHGFSHAKEFDPQVLEARQDVRAMCEEDKCHAYAKNWTCPPFCGTLEECQAKMLSYKKGVLLQTEGKLNKVIDFIGYIETGKRHNDLVYSFADKVRELYPGCLVLGGGGCRICKKCAHPEPCRNPDRAVPSMEGYGLLVSKVCEAAGLPYYYGEKTITYVACVLYND
ncbi:MAG: DUF2284 domain-containing protein [Clostridia bacterium]|nr:DUF2284 domain-containing protein [Clostridia bacterium]